MTMIVAATTRNPTIEYRAAASQASPLASVALRAPDSPVVETWDEARRPEEMNVVTGKSS
jgi:hypothetical protein